MLTLTEKAEAGSDLMNSKRGLSLKQMSELLNEARKPGKDLFEVIAKAYNCGFYQGYMQHTSEVRRARTCRK